MSKGKIKVTENKNADLLMRSENSKADIVLGQNAARSRSQLL